MKCSNAFYDVNCAYILYSDGPFNCHFSYLQYIIFLLICFVRRQFKAKGLTYLRVGSPLAKIARTELFLVKVETTKLRREAILKDGDENISLFPKLRTHMGVHGLREYGFEGQTFYLTAPSRGLLENLVMETTIDEWDLIHDDDKKFRSVFG